MIHNGCWPGDFLPEDENGKLPVNALLKQLQIPVEDFGEHTIDTVPEENFDKLRAISPRADTSQHNASGPFDLPYTETLEDLYPIMLDNSMFNDWDPGNISMSSTALYAFPDAYGTTGEPSQERAAFRPCGDGEMLSRQANK